MALEDCYCPNVFDGDYSLMPTLDINTLLTQAYRIRKNPFSLAFCLILVQKFPLNVLTEVTEVHCEISVGALLVFPNISDQQNIPYFLYLVLPLLLHSPFTLFLTRTGTVTGHLDVHILKRQSILQCSYILQPSVVMHQ